MNDTYLSKSELEIRDARETELAAMVNLTKASYAEFQYGSPSGFWEAYMTNIEEAIMRAPDTERIGAVGSVLLCHRYFKAMIPRYVCSQCFQILEGTE